MVAVKVMDEYLVIDLSGRERKAVLWCSKMVSSE